MQHYCGIEPEGNLFFTEGGRNIRDEGAVTVVVLAL